MSGNSKRSKKRVREEEKFKEKRIKKIKKNSKTYANTTATSEALSAKEKPSNIETLDSEGELDNENNFSSEEQLNSEEELENEDLISEDEVKSEEESEIEEEFEGEEELRSMEELDKENDISYKEQLSSEEELENEEVLKSEDEFGGEEEFETEEELESEEELGSEEELDSKDFINEEFYKKDPFFCHFNGNIPKDKEPLLDDFANWKLKKVNWPHLGRLYAHLPELDQTFAKKEKKLLDDDDDDIVLPKIGVFPDSPSPKAFDAIANGFVHKNLINNINRKMFSGEQSEIFTILSNYLNFWHTEATHEKWNKIWRVYAIHCLNHILKAREQIYKNSKIVKRYEKKKELPPRLEDQGFAKPRILILQPNRNSAYRLIKTMIDLLGMEVMKKKEFENYYAPPVEEGDAFKQKPEDFQKTFAGNIDDDFRIGVALSKKAFKLGTPFSKSDIIIVSPLCLRRLLEEEKGKKNNEDLNHPKVVDVLSSIEIFIIDQADIIYMQNWEHVSFIEDSLNKWPENLKSLNVEIYRIHQWYFENFARYFRQTIVFSSTSSDYIRGVLRRARNVAGSVELVNDKKGVISDIKVQADLTMLCIRNKDPSVLQFDATFNFFTKELLPRLRKNNMSHVLIYIPDYCDYVRLNYFFHKDGGTSCATINEYMIEENAKVAKARSSFYHGYKKYLLYTERFHFNRRYKIKGVRHIVFYSPPLYPQFFKEICEFLSEQYQNRKEKFDSISYIYLLYHLADKGKLIDLIGTDKVVEILKSGKYYHSYLTGV